jgi:hypothetical protein
MRLSELHPELEDAGEGAAYLEFDCPAHPGRMEHADPAADPPFEGFPDRVRVKIAPGPQGTHVWGWNGERDFEKLTLTPSIDMHGHWHGHVTNGEVTTV